MLDELLCVNMMSSHVKKDVIFSEVKKSPLPWLHNPLKRT